MSRNLGYFTFRKVQNDNFYATINAYNLIFKGRTEEGAYNKLKRSNNFILTRDKNYVNLEALRLYFRSRLEVNELGKQPRYKKNGPMVPKKFNVNKERDFSTLTLVDEER